MNRLRHRWERLRKPLLWLVCAVMLAGRIAAPVLAMPMLVQASLTAAGICHSETDGAPGGDHAPGQHDHCQDCLACHAAPLAGIAPTPALAPPSVADLRRPASPRGGTSPASPARQPFQSRAPPSASV
jgi:hypothetical protein